jgi:hypothetical protein
MTMTSTKTGNKSVIINADTHSKFKELCKSKNLKLGGVIENLIKIYLDDQKRIQKIIDEYYEENE